jgi:hypothetical protein
MRTATPSAALQQCHVYTCWRPYAGKGYFYTLDHRGDRRSHSHERRESGNRNLDLDDSMSIRPDHLCGTRRINSLFATFGWTGQLV